MKFIRYVPPGHDSNDQGEYALLHLLGLILVRQQDGDHRFPGITWANDKLQRDKHCLCRTPITRHPVELEQQPITRILAGSNSVRGHVDNIPEPSRLILMELFLAVIVSPGHTIGPSIGSQCDWPFVMSPVKC